MRTWLAVALATIAFPFAAPAHVVDKSSITVAVGQQTTVSVSDDGAGCVAEMKASVVNPLLASVTPTQPVTATNATFTVSGRQPGQTFVELQWSGVMPCFDQGSVRVPLTVTGGTPQIIVTSLPPGLAQETGVGGASESFSIANIGSAPGQYLLLRGAAFFTVTPLSGTLQPGDSTIITLAGLPQPAGLFEGTVELTGEGVAPGTVIPVRLISANRPSTPPRPRPTANRVDVVGREATGVARFLNEGTGTLRGVVTSDVPWIEPVIPIVDVQGGESVDVPFRINAARRPSGVSASGSLSIHYLLSPIGKSAVDAHDSPGTSQTLVSVVSTVPPPSAPGVVPPLGGEVALFATGVGRLQGSVGLYLSDLTLTSLEAAGELEDVRLYYTPVGGSTKTAAVDGVSASLSTALGDLVRGVFESDGRSGSLQIRSDDVTRLSAAANILNSSNPAGTFGTAIPILRSDRATPPGQTLVIPGIRKTASSHTNLWLQEGSGETARVRVAAYDSAGALTKDQTVELPPFGATQLIDPFPTGTVALRLEHAQGSSGTFLGYATPVDRSSGDFWAVTDWARQYGTATTDSVVLPVAGSVPGANNTDFRTDAAFAAGGAGGASVRVRYVDRNGTSSEATVSIPPFGSVVYEDVTRSLFGIQGDALGYLVAIPLSGSFHVSGRTYNLVAGSGATYGSSVPALPLSSAIGFGQTRRFGGIDDAADPAVAEARPGTTRTNFGLVEVGGAPARVRITISYLVPSSLVTAIGRGSTEVQLAPGQFVLTSRIASAILGNYRRSFGDLRNLQVDFEVIDGAGKVIPFLSSTDNGTGDSILRTE